MKSLALEKYFLRAGNIRPINKRYAACVKKADEEGIKLFGMDDKRCWTTDSLDSNPGNTYNKFGSSGQCTEKKGLSTGLSKSFTLFVYQKDEKGKAILTR